MDGPCYQFLSCSALTLDENRQVAGRDLSDKLVELLHGLALSDNLAAYGVLPLYLPFKLSHLFREFPCIYGPCSQDIYFLYVKRLCYIIVCPPLHGLYRIFHGVLGSHYYHRGISYLCKYIQAALSRHHDIHEDKGIPLALDLFKGLNAVLSKVHRVTLLLHGLLQDKPYRLLIICNKNSFHTYL